MRGTAASARTTRHNDCNTTSTRQTLADTGGAHSLALLSATLVAFKLLKMKAFCLTAAKNIHDMDETRLQGVYGEVGHLSGAHVTRNANINARSMRWEAKRGTWQEQAP